MKKYLLLLAGSLALASTTAFADSTAEANLNPDPFGNPWIANLPELTPEQEALLKNLPEIKLNEVQAASPQALPSSVDNSQNIHFRPIFSQVSNSCGQASGIGYAFTYEMSVARNLDAGLVENQYPEHFTWNFLNNGTQNGSWYYDGWNIIRDNGIPNVSTYGSMSTESPYTKWMTGYDKYYQGMSNRTLAYYRINVATAEGIETLKQWFDNKNNGSAIGGVANFACNAFNTEDAVLESDSSRPGETIVKRFGDDGYHAMTFVGYDDDVKVDINGDGMYTNDLDINNDGTVDVKDWEIGAVKIANSWGESWGNSGFKWLSYSALAHGRDYGGITNSDVHTLYVKETYSPSMTLKVTMKHSNRGKISIRAGVASSESAAEPEHYIVYQPFNYRGGAHPMLGESTDPIEIGLDVTSLIGAIGGFENAKKFFMMVHENDGASTASGQVISVAAIDYLNGGIEYGPTTGVVIEDNTETVIPVYLKYDTCEEFIATNSEHETANRAYSETVTEGQTCYGTFCFGGTNVTTWYAQGSDENLGTSGSTVTTLIEESDGVYATGECYTPDITAPELTLLGDNPMVINQYTDYVEPGATAADDVDGDLTSTITINGNPSTSIIGNYVVTYRVTDNAGNQTEERRDVEVVAAPDCVDYTNTVANHESADRAYSNTVKEGETCIGTFCYGGTNVTTWYAQGSSENLGQNNSATVTLRTNPDGEGYVTGECPAEQQAPQIDSYNVNIDGQSVTISGTASDPDGDLQAIVLYFAGGGVECQGLENWTCPTMNEVQPGEHIAAVKAIDSRIVDSGLTEISFTVEGPRAPTIDSFEGTRYSTIIMFSGTASDADGNLTAVKLHGDKIETKNCTLDLPDFFCQVNDMLPGEDYTFYTTAEDATGNVSEPSANIEFSLPENNAPVLETWNYEVIGNDLIVTGVSSDIDNDITKTIVQVKGGAYFTCEGIEQWTCELQNIPDGTYTFSIITNDSYSNVSSLVEFTLEIEGDSAPVIDSYDFSVDGDVFTITGTASDADGDLDKVILINGPGSLVCEGTENFVCTIPGLSVGDYEIFIAAEDAAGNSSGNYGPIAFSYDGVAPTIDTYEYSVDGLTVTFTGTASDVDGNLDRIALTLGAAGGINCTGTEIFTCIWTADEAGTAAIGLAAYDTRNLVGSIPQIEITFTDEAECITDTNFNHVEAGRAYVGGISNLYAYATGSDEDLGLYGSIYYSVSTSLEETSAGVWAKVTSCP